MNGGRRSIRPVTTISSSIIIQRYIIRNSFSNYFFNIGSIFNLCLSTELKKVFVQLFFEINYVADSCSIKRLPFPYLHFYPKTFTVTHFVFPYPIATICTKSSRFRLLLRSFQGSMPFSSDTSFHLASNLLEGGTLETLTTCDRPISSSFSKTSQPILHSTSTAFIGNTSSVLVLAPLCMSPWHLAKIIQSSFLAFTCGAISFWPRFIISQVKLSPPIPLSSLKYHRQHQRLSYQNLVQSSPWQQSTMNYLFGTPVGEVCVAQEHATETKKEKEPNGEAKFNQETDVSSHLSEFQVAEERGKETSCDSTIQRVYGSPNVEPISEMSLYASADFNSSKLESRFFEMLNNKSRVPVQTKLHRFHDAARFLFSAGEANPPPISLRFGKPGYYGPSLKAITALRDIVESMTLQDLGLDRSTIIYNYKVCLENQKTSGSPRVAAFWNIVNTPMLCIVLFFLPSGCPLEPHNHPGMVVLSKVLFGSLKTEILAALGPPDPTVDNEPVFPPDDPGITMLPSNEAILDYGAIQSPKSAADIAEQYAVLKESKRLSEQSALRRRMIVGSRIQRQVGDELDVVEMYNGVVHHSSRQQSDTSRIGSPSVLALSPFITKKPSEEGTTQWDCIVPCDQWPTTMVCTPCYGNIHRFEAESDFAIILDIIAPSYEYPRFRDCQYIVASGITSPNHREQCHDSSTATTSPTAGQPLPGQYRVSILDEEAAGPDVFFEFEPNPVIKS